MSLTKNELKDIQSLLSKKGRNLKKRFLAEGVRLLEEAVRHQVTPETVVCAQAALSDRGQQLILQFRISGARVEEVHLRQLESIAATESTQGILATFPLPQQELTELYRPAYRKLLLCENISDPGNLGTLLRSALAFGMDMVMLAGRSADPYSPKVVRASTGAVFGLPIVETSVDELLAFRSKTGAQLAVGDIQGSSSLTNGLIQARAPFILAVGSEAEGVSEELLRQADLHVRIDHSNSVESLNAAVAGSILMYEMYKVYE